MKYRGRVDKTRIRKVVPVKEYIILSREDVEEGDEIMVIPVDVFLSLLYWKICVDVLDTESLIAV